MEMQRTAVDRAGDGTTTHQVEARFADCDPFGIVFYPVILRWFDDAAWAHFAAFGLTPDVLRERLGCAGFPVANLSVEFRAPVQWGEVLAIRTRPIRLGRSSFDLEQELSAGDLRVVGRSTRIWMGVEPDGARPSPQPIPDSIRSGALHSTDTDNSGESDR